ncbi:MAG: hypothetical protein CL581_12315 [Alteromonadaceae bacterium]|nr:hypothetical protein [Alteromonadaceae bacterium]MBH86263.1 hypothetical protein [Alteromonadaceae bacterium]|tara:strand:+ start:436 stop:939 length:504 start_codon:yes stop_codon:yes gene_type:complete
MIRFLLTATCTLALTGCATNNNVKVVYSGLTFHIPPSVVAVGSTGGDQHFLGFKYSPTPGEKFVGFSKENDIGNGGCGYSAFFKQVLQLSNTNNCDQAAVKSFHIVFNVGSQSGAWPSDQYEAYYFPGKDKKTFVFLVLDDNNAIKIDSDFLDKESMRAVVSEYLTH